MKLVLMAVSQWQVQSVYAKKNSGKLRDTFLLNIKFNVGKKKGGGGPQKDSTQNKYSLLQYQTGSEVTKFSC